MSPPHPAPAAVFASATASSVEIAATPEITAPRLPTAFTTVSSTAFFSAPVSVAVSPSEPSGTMDVHPASIIIPPCFARKAWSTVPSGLKGVVSAGMTPFQKVFMGGSLSANAPAERIRGVQQRGALGAHERLAGDRRHDAAFGEAIRPLEVAADDALLPPRRALGQLSIGGEAREPRARSRAARRAVVGVARAQHEVAAIVGVAPRLPQKLDVIDLAAVATRDRGPRERAAHRAAEFRERPDLREVERPVVRVDEEEPVASPRHVAGDRAEAIDCDVDGFVVSIRDDVFQRDLALRPERAGHRSDRRVEAMRAS